MDTRPLYPIGVVSELLNVHPETLRVWEKRYSIIQPQRRSGKRFYSNDDLKRLQFVQRLINEGLNLPAVHHYLRFYPCWQLEDCPACMHRTKDTSCAKPCWKEPGTFCQVTGEANLCAECEFRPKEIK